MDLGIADHVAIVTGGGRGIGAGICRALAAEGAQVVVLDRDAAAAGELADDIRSGGGQAVPLTVDVTDPTQVNEAVQRVIADFGRIHILVNCAGFSRDAPVAEMTDEQWNAVIDVCLNGTFYMTRAVVPHMTASSYGRIINISSRAHNGEIYKLNYCAAKAGVDGLTYALALELGKQGITANAIAPGFIDTERLRGVTYFADIQARAMEKTYTARLGVPQDVAGATLYLASAHSGFITGEVITLSGGRWR